MNRQEYMQELYQRLGPLPLTLEDVNDAMRFYEEYFDEAGPEQEQEVIAELGSPAYVAAQVALKLTGSLTPQPGKKKGIGKNVNVFLLIILGIFASPVALPLAFAAVVLIVSLLFAALIAAAAFGISGVVCIAVGAGMAAYSVTLFITANFATAIYFIGSGLLTIGIGGFLTRFGWWLCALLIKGARHIGTIFFIKASESKKEGGQYA